MCTQRDEFVWRRRCAAVLAGWLGIAAPPLPAQTPRPDPVAEAAADAAALERQFWRCDVAAEHTRLDTATIQLCGQVAERLRATRFGGDFDAMLAWWRANKAARHAAVAAARP